MARLPYVDPADAPEPVKDALERVPPLNIFRMMANAETAFRPWLRWGATLLGDLELDPLMRELAILRVARLTPHAEYEWVQHVPIAKAVGATDDQVSALERDEAGLSVARVRAARRARLSPSRDTPGRSASRERRSRVPPGSRRSDRRSPWWLAW